MNGESSRSGRYRRGASAVVVAGLVWMGTGSTAAAAPADPPFPVNERLSYEVSWMGVYCGRMTLASFVDGEGDDATYHIVMTARTSKPFDQVYRVRSRIESEFSGRLMSTVRYHDVSREKKRVNDDLYQIDLERAEVHRTNNGKEQTFSLADGHVYDPLAYIYRLRRLVPESGTDVSLALATADGAVETVARVEERRRIRTPLGRREAMVVIPQPRDEMLFSKSGEMEIWLGTDDEGTPYRVVFDLSFGKLVAELVEVERGPGLAPVEPDDLPGEG
jgi:hypothetical protein